MSSTAADLVGVEPSANEQPAANDQESSVPTTAAPSAEAVSASKKKSANSKSKKKRQHAALQSMISQLKQLCTQVGQQTSFIDASTGKMLTDMSVTSSPADIETTPSSQYHPLCVERGMRIPPSVWKPQLPAHTQATAGAAAGGSSTFRSGLPPPREIRLTAVERESLQREERQKEVRMKLRCAVTVQEFETLLLDAEAANMKHEAELVRKKIQKLTTNGA